MTVPPRDADRVDIVTSSGMQRIAYALLMALVVYVWFVGG